MNGKTSDGKWAPIGGERDNPGNRSVSGWTEGDAWVYTWGAFHDLAGLVDMMGGADKYNAKLDQHFSGGHNKHSNEPSHHYGYLYDYSGEPWKTQAKVREIAKAEYANAPSGIDGDDDCGQMSSWLLFTAMGFYPVNPASAEYMIGSPMFGKMSMKLGNGKTFTVVAKNNSAGNVYIQSATLNGKPLNEPVIRYSDIMQGSRLEFVMGAQPSKWGSSWRGKAIAAK
jgi:predicted alpha-1,2-mannosidase